MGLGEDKTHKTCVFRILRFENRVPKIPKEAQNFWTPPAHAAGVGIRTKLFVTYNLGQILTAPTCLFWLMGCYNAAAFYFTFFGALLLWSN